MFSKTYFGFPTVSCMWHIPIQHVCSLVSCSPLIWGPTCKTLKIYFFDRKLSIYGWRSLPYLWSSELSEKKREKQSIDKSYKLHRLPRDRNFMKTKETFLICLLEYFKGNHWKHKDFFSHGIFYHCPHQISCSQSPKERLSCLYTEIVFFFLEKCWVSILA